MCRPTAMIKARRAVAPMSRYFRGNAEARAGTLIAVPEDCAEGWFAVETAVATAPDATTGWEPEGRGICTSTGNCAALVLMGWGGGSSTAILFPEVVSRFRRCSSARISDACW